MAISLTENKKIGYVGEFKFPDGDAYSQRALALGKILRELGMNVFFQGLNTPHHYPTKGVFQNFKYKNIENADNKSHVGKIGKLATLLHSGCFSRNQLLLECSKFDIIIVAGGYSRYLIPYLSFAKKNGIKLIVDVVEWFEYSHLPLGKYGPFAWDVDFALKHLVKKSDGVIGISSYLTNYYLSKGVKCIRMPQLVDLQEEKWNFPEPESFDSNSLNLIYAGVPGRKDLLGNAVRGLKILRQENHKVNIHLLGPTLDDVRDCLDKDAQLVDELNGSGLFFYGRIPQEKIPVMLAKADFSILLRPDARYAHAGFPTKLVESFAAGVPVIANLTSDIGMYLTDNNNGIVAEGWSVNAFVTAVKKACKMTTDELKIMKINAKKTAIDGFDYRMYSNQMAKFLSEL